MTDKTVWFGTQERMQWVPAPASAPGVGRSLTKWRTGGQYINGGQWRKESASGARVCTLQWPVMSGAKVRKISAFLEGSYGEGPFYFSDPFAEGVNSAPQWLAAPWLATKDGPKLAPTIPERVVTPSSIYDYPAYGAKYTLTGGDSTNGVLLPVPEGLTAYVGVHGTATGSARVLVNGYAVPLLGVDTSQRTNYTVSGTNWLYLRLSGSGTITLYGVLICVGDTQPLLGGWIKGEGYSGLRLDGDPQITGYSSAQDREAITADFIETSPWETGLDSAEFESHLSGVGWYQQA